MRPLFARAVAEHDALMAEADAERYLRRTGWLKLYRSDAAFAARRANAARAEFGIAAGALDRDGGARARAVARRCSATRCTGAARRASAIRWR